MIREVDRIVGSGETKSVNEREFFVELLLRSRVAKTGRPRKEEGERGTTQIRVFDEMDQMVADLRLVLPLSTAQIMQRVGYANLKELHETYKKQIDAVKESDRIAEESRRKAQEEAAAMLNEQKSEKSRKPKGGS